MFTVFIFCKTIVVNDFIMNIYLIITNWVIACSSYRLINITRLEI